VAIVGALLVLAGGVAAVTGALAMYCIELFSEGGRFHDEGFGFGSFTFANIASQVVGTCLIALVFIPLGHGQRRVTIRGAEYPTPTRRGTEHNLLL